MINFKEKIVSGKSIAGIHIGNTIDDILSEVYTKGYELDIQDFSNNPVPVIRYIIDKGIIKIVASTKGIVKAIFCSNGYEGRYNDIFYPNMTVDQIIKKSEYQIFLHGTLMVNKDFGVGYNVPEEYSHLDYVDQLPKDLLLTEMFVMKEDWWKT
ncbi:hypothetical protein V3A08_11210 [Tenacibaculum maritimum]|uniref:Uncharacterized protein n=1 Tax=Tenacibaculum maritimum NCIMB 2154 TaxID=1349785 RepID=A0A2H1ED89_9FLAO|nr:hypothetical protein [Tenacibaculum maritimum]CAA0149803.1 conserved hypothetical protein [Tenacibaculum maritimum]CAA0189042.1 conserved hypothetical protein [Tenacibaculum maritimum]CAA0198896.1 conserved hypothetical protein [Tenacibaculum maritimum]SFZ84333.1 conserved protein of unknown function [Tenacibaculum maritimum NCIMB 2154]SFZ84358.1 conserved protein of unknown function [Tenacibaculum maritimum NCIMB 2154]